MKSDKKDDSSLIDTSKMSEGQRVALEMAESARDTRALSGFAASLFSGRANFRSISPFPEQDYEDRKEGDGFIRKLKDFLDKEVDPDAIDREGEIPDEVIEGLAKLGAFGIKIPKKYGGLGLTQTNYSRAAMLLGQYCGNITALLSAHQSIGLPQPLLVFGTEAQKEKFLPLCAGGEVSAFALTENNVGSDPARMETEATPTADGDGYLINGEKLWCTNGLKAKAVVVMAKTPTEEKPHATTAFIVPTESEGVEIVTRCHFMGLRALYNGVLRFNNVRVPKENIIAGEGRGLKVALTTLNTGRLTLPAACSGLMRRCLDILLPWCGEREQWGQAIGKHAAIAGKLADITADLFATEAMVLYTSALVDSNKKADIRLEAALAKLWGTEAAWAAADQTMQVKGGRGYETADSLKNRGEKADPVERLLRDCRINTIFEGSTEIMRLFIAREALDPHLRRGAAALDTRKQINERIQTALEAGLFYAKWYPTRYLPLDSHFPSTAHPVLRKHYRKIAAHSRRLSRALFHAMARYGSKLEREQLLLGRFVDVGAELFAMSAACSRTQLILDGEASHSLIKNPVEVTDYLCSRGHQRIEALFSNRHNGYEKKGYKVARELLG